MKTSKSFVDVLAVKKIGSPPNNTGKTQIFDSNDYYNLELQKNDERASKKSFVVEVDDQGDFDSLEYLLDPMWPPEIVLLNTNYDMINYNWMSVTFENV